MRRLLAVLLCLTAMAGARADVLRIAAAADLAYCLEALNSAFSAREPDADIRTSTGSSGNFFTQIRQGAPFDLFLSADMDYPRALVTAGLADAGSLTPYATGRLALWTLRTDLDPARGLAVLQDSSVHRIALANPDHAPYGRAARAALETAGLWQTLSSRIVLGENVAQTAQFVATGNADIGSDVPLQIALREAEPAESFRDAFAVMIAGEQERRCAVRVVFAHGRDFIGIEQEG